MKKIIAFAIINFVYLTSYSMDSLPWEEENINFLDHLNEDVHYLFSARTSDINKNVMRFLDDNLHIMSMPLYLTDDGRPSIDCKKPHIRLKMIMRLFKL